MTKPNPEKDILIKEYIKNGIITCTRSGKILSNGKIIGHKHNSGYTTISLKNKAKKRFVILAHRVVWIYFKGNIPIGFMPNHKDGNKRNNAVSNLELLTEAENIQHAFDTGLNKMGQIYKGVNNWQSKLNTQQVKEIRSLYGTISVRKIAKMFNMSHPSILDILSGKSYKPESFKLKLNNRRNA